MRHVIQQDRHVTLPETVLEKIPPQSYAFIER
jgi:hypothetical protein